MEQPKDLCMCMCHVEGVEIMHIQACCSRTYEKYLNEDRTIKKDYKW